MQSYYDAIQKLRQTTIFHPQFDSAYKKIMAVIDLKSHTNIAQHIFCIGESGTGKSTLKNLIKKKYAELYPSSDDHSILLIDTPATPTVKNIAEEVLRCLGDPLFNKGSAAEKTARILCYIKELKVRMIIFDELQHFIDQGNKSSPRQVSDWLKSLIDKANIPTILMGLQNCEVILNSNHQLRRRFSQQISLVPFSLDTRDSTAIFASIIMSCAEILPQLKEALFLDQDLLYRIHYATNGVIDYVIKLLIGLFDIISQRPIQKIPLQYFAEAFTTSIWSEASSELNPFHEKFTWTSLNKSGMPFYFTYGKNSQ